jgi:four helix bundle protein
MEEEKSCEINYLHFLDMAYGSSREIEYQASLALHLKSLPDAAHEHLHATCVETAKVLSGLIRSLR